MLIIKMNVILILGKGLKKVLDGATLNADTEYSIDFTEAENSFCLNLHCNVSSSFLLVNGVIYQLRAKNL